MNGLAFFPFMEFLGEKIKLEFTDVGNKITTHWSKQEEFYKRMGTTQEKETQIMKLKMLLIGSKALVLNV